MTHHRLIYIFSFIACLLSFGACSLVVDGEEQDDSVNMGEVFINLSIGVNNGVTAGTRADWWPRGGEHGNFNEAAFQRENEVTKVTFILFQTTDKKGLNSAGNPVLDFVRCYSVTRANTAKQAEGGNWEGWYVTGYQSLGNHRLRFSESYHAIAIANLDLTTVLTEGASQLDDLKDVLQKQLYLSGSAKTPAVNCQQFIMSSANNNNYINFAAVSPDKKGDELYFDLDSQGIEVERMVARIDFWSLNSEYKTKNGSDKDYAEPGYVYTVYDKAGTSTTNDRFVITHITPFNLYDKNEFLFKHVVVDEDKKTIERLADEDGTYRAVVDPELVGTTPTKTATSTPATGDYLNQLSQITEASLPSNEYRHAVKDMHLTVSANNGVDGKSGGFMLEDSYVDVDEHSHTIGPAEDIIIAYPMENTLPLNGSLYHYATGIIIEGDYYKNDDLTQKTHRVYYGFLRHASRTNAPNAYDALISSDFDTPAKINDLKNYNALDEESPMLFATVRNNIYRIHVDKVYQRESPLSPPKIKLKIEVKKWDKFVHDPIHF